jgi:hypothetical protein
MASGADSLVGIATDLLRVQAGDTTESAKAEANVEMEAEEVAPEPEVTAEAFVHAEAVVEVEVAEEEEAAAAPMSPRHSEQFDLLMQMISAPLFDAPDVDVDANDRDHVDADNRIDGAQTESSLSAAAAVSSVTPIVNESNPGRMVAQYIAQRRHASSLDADANGAVNDDAVHAEPTALASSGSSAASSAVPSVSVPSAHERVALPEMFTRMFAPRASAAAASSTDQTHASADSMRTASLAAVPKPLPAALPAAAHVSGEPPLGSDSTIARAGDRVEESDCDAGHISGRGGNNANGSCSSSNCGSVSGGRISSNTGGATARVLSEVIATRILLPAAAKRAAEEAYLTELATLIDADADNDADDAETAADDAAWIADDESSENGAREWGSDRATLSSSSSVSAISAISAPVDSTASAAASSLDFSACATTSAAGSASGDVDRALSVFLPMAQPPPTLPGASVAASAKSHGGVGAVIDSVAAAAAAATTGPNVAESSKASTMGAAFGASNRIDGGGNSVSSQSASPSQIRPQLSGVDGAASTSVSGGCGGSVKAPGAGPAGLYSLFLFGGGGRR